VYRVKNVPPPPTDRDRHYHENVTDRDRHSLEHAINCVLLQSAKRETHKFMGKLESSRMILI
jgi:hypothetical protein